MPTPPRRRSRAQRRPPLDLSLTNFRVSNETTTMHTPPVEALLTQGLGYLKEKAGADAERCLRQALQLEPTPPDLWHNLAAALSLQGRADEALAIVRDLHRRFPDYLFARTTLARSAIQHDDLDQAAALLAPLHARRAFHVSEWNALADVQLSLLLLQGNLPLARTWFAMWADSQPNHPQLAIYRPYCFPDA